MSWRAAGSSIAELSSSVDRAALPAVHQYLPGERLNREHNPSSAHSAVVGTP
jgi:hypothetical protein